MHEIFDEILRERERQDAKWGGQKHDDKHNHLDWVTFVGSHSAASLTLSLAPEVSKGMWFENQMVRVAALAVAAIQSSRRKRGFTNAGNPGL